MKVAIYARQSIEKKDSASIETQIEKCKSFYPANTHFEIYQDKGYSGATTERPAFEKLINDIKKGIIEKVISYRLDRISRSLSDFANLIQFLKKHNVEFTSATEQFDTSSPVGRAMVYIIMVFAQLERETLQCRIKDNYYYRAKQGLFTGGNCPIGYEKEKIIIDGKTASILKVNIDDANLVKRIFDMYTNKEYSLHKIVTILNDEQIYTQKGKTWSSQKISRILKNPAYVENSIDIYNYFNRNNYIISNNADEFTGMNGCLLFGKETGSNTERKQQNISQQILSIGQHKPIIDSNIWIQAQYRLSKNKQNKRTGKSKVTWLTGMTKCGECGFSVSIKSYSNKYHYLHCRGRSNRGAICNHKKMHRCEEIEKFIEKELFEKIEKIKSSDFLYKKTNTQSPELNNLKLQLLEIDNKIKNLIEQLAVGTTTINKYINDKIEDLDFKRKEINKKIEDIQMSVNAKQHRTNIKDIINTFEHKNWYKLSPIQKHDIASLFIKNILLYSDTIKIIWFL